MTRILTGLPQLLAPQASHFVPPATLADRAALLIRDATPADVPAMADIYAHHVVHGTGTFEDIPPTLAEMGQRLARILDHGWAWLVAEAPSGAVLGYAYYGQFRDRTGFRHTAENSIYIRHDVRGHGLGKALVQAVLDRAEAAGFRQMTAMIGDAENIGSIGLHLALGYRQVGVMKAAGIKFGRWLDVVLMQRSLGQGHRAPPG